MAARKKAAKKGSAWRRAAPQPKPVLEKFYYRGCCGTPPMLYKVEATAVVKAPGGGYDLTDVPPGDVFVWARDTETWVPASLPPVGAESNCVRHTKNAANVGA